ncbi:hypothetical protein F2P56_023733 [Juglans regia]|uniref:Uncharacterized protein n=1 Tax=Juglans regia TaxID=51240 RepID=A0A833T740_JUGRE|nr:hypothetical protein F2P56_023733 [Juglans regia]
MHKKYQLATLKKGSNSMPEYFNKVKNLASSLRAAGYPLPDSEFVIYLLAGLGSNYEALVTSLTTRPDSISIPQIYSYLLNHESRLSHQTQSLLSRSPLSANSTGFRPSDSSNVSSRGRFSSNRRGRHGRGFHRGGYSGPRNPSSPNQYFSTRPTCQLCNKPGHLVINCYHRFDYSYQASAPSSLVANLTEFPPSTAINSWFPDTAAMHHFTPEYTNLNLGSSPYQGSDQISIGDGSSLPIHNIGSAQLSSSTGFTYPGSATSGSC